MEAIEQQRADGKVSVLRPAPKIADVPIGDLKRDYRFYPRESVDYLTVGRFMDAMKAGAIFPPIRICAATGRIIDGFHRYTAYERLGREMVRVVGEDVADDTDFFLRSVEANKAHGLGYSPVDHEKIIKIAKLLHLHREKISVAMAIPVEKFESLAKLAPTPSGTFQPLTHLSTPGPEMKLASNKGIALERRVRDPIARAGHLFRIGQAILYLRSEDCDLSDESVFNKVRELEAALAARLNPDAIRERVYERIVNGCITVGDLSLELFMPRATIQNHIDGLIALGRIAEDKAGGKKVNQRGSMTKIYFPIKAESSTQHEGGFVSTTEESHSALSSLT